MLPKDGRRVRWPLATADCAPAVVARSHRAAAVTPDLGDHAIIEEKLLSDISKPHTLGTFADLKARSGQSPPELLAEFEASLHQQIVHLQEQILHMREETGGPDGTSQGTTGLELDDTNRWSGGGPSGNPLPKATQRFPTSDLSATPEY
jgi:hypothetical protein